eukprot:Nk52_evm23s539 gene=Nk52_evmTU23s539
MTQLQGQLRRTLHSHNSRRRSHIANPSVTIPLLGGLSSTYEEQTDAVHGAVIDTEGLREDLHEASVPQTDSGRRRRSSYKHAVAGLDGTAGSRPYTLGATGSSSKKRRVSTRNPSVFSGKGGVGIKRRKKSYLLGSPMASGSRNEDPSIVRRLTGRSSYGEDQWYYLGLFQKPRLLIKVWEASGNSDHGGGGGRISDKEINANGKDPSKNNEQQKKHENVDRKVSMTEVFSDLIMTTIVTYLGQDLRENAHASGWEHANVFSYCIRFIAVWNSWYSQTLYSTWFNTDDIFHKVYAAAYMVANIGIGLNCKEAPLGPNGVFFAFSLAVSRIMLCIAIIRAMYYIEKFRTMGYFLLYMYFLDAGFWLMSAIIEEQDRIWGYLLCIAVFAFNSGILLVSVSHTERIPVHVEHFIERFAGFVVIVLGELVGDIIVEPADKGIGGYTLILLGFLVVFNIKMLYFDVDTPSPEDHAISLSRLRGFIWTWVHSLLVLAIGLIGSGLQILCNAAAAGSSNLKASAMGRYIFGMGIVVFLGTVFINRFLHNSYNNIKSETDISKKAISDHSTGTGNSEVGSDSSEEEEAILQAEDDDERKRQILYIVGVLQTSATAIVICIMVFITFGVPTEKLSDTSFSSIIVFLTLVLWTVNLVDEGLVNYWRLTSLKGGAIRKDSYDAPIHMQSDTSDTNGRKDTRSSALSSSSSERASPPNEKTPLLP